jgi:hypothetical protein
MKVFFAQQFAHGASRNLDFFESFVQFGGYIADGLTWALSAQPIHGIFVSVRQFFRGARTQFVRYRSCFAEIF